MTQHPDPEKPRVLIVDDDDGLREAIVSCLRLEGLAVTAVATGAEAVAVVDLVKPHAALIDVLLPDAGGPALAEVLRREHGLEEMPVLFTTGLGVQPVKKLLPRVPVLFKPFSREELVARVWRMLTGPTTADAA